MVLWDTKNLQSKQSYIPMQNEFEKIIIALNKWETKTTCIYPPDGVGEIATNAIYRSYLCKQINRPTRSIMAINAKKYKIA